MKKFFAEFKEFISKGSVLDMAIGIVIGGAFTAVINSVVDNIIMPLISVITGGINFESWNVVLGSGEEPPVLGFGLLIAAIIKFIIIALVIFMIVKTINKARALKEKEKAAEPPTTKKCPFCFSEIPIQATKCACCTADLPKDEA